MITKLVIATKSEYIIQEIKQDITNGDIKPGEQLIQRELADRYNTSVTPVREALMQLHSEGIVTYLPHKGATVIPITHKDIDDICKIREALEDLALELAFPNLTPEDFRELWNMNSSTTHAYEQRDWMTVDNLTQGLHLRIYERANAPLLVDTILFVLKKYPWYLLPAYYERSDVFTMEHSYLLEALEQGDLRKAKQVLHGHLIGWTKYLKTYLKNDKK